MEFHHRNNRPLKSLIQLAKNGYYPLFDHLLKEFPQIQTKKKLTGNEKAKAKTLFKKLCEHHNIERQRTVLYALKTEERKLLLRAFFKMVENEILDTGVTLQ